LYGLDILSELWSVLYLQAERKPTVLSGQEHDSGNRLPEIASGRRTNGSRGTGALSPLCRLT
jgi:hypothetical protein